ncbi:hypothetical protein ACHAWC_002665 [Mediolabrus comicus]
MDLLASLGLENALPEQSTRLVHPGVISALEKCSSAAHDNDDGGGGNNNGDDGQCRLGFNYCLTCGASLTTTKSSHQTTTAAAAAASASTTTEKAKKIITCKGCNRVNYCSELCRRIDAEPQQQQQQQHGTNGDEDNEGEEGVDENAVGHSPVICSLLNLCNDDELVEDELYDNDNNDDSNNSDSKLNNNNNNNNNNNQKYEIAKYRIQTERESYPATLFNMLSDDSPSWLVEALSRRLRYKEEIRSPEGKLFHRSTGGSSGGGEVEGERKKRRGKRDRQSFTSSDEITTPTTTTTASSSSASSKGNKKELVLHIVGAQSDSELWGWDGSSSSTNNNKNEMLDAYAEASSNVLSYLQNFIDVITGIRLVFVGPGCPQQQQKRGKDEKKNKRTTVSKTMLYVETHCCNYGDEGGSNNNNGDGDNDTIPPPDAIIFFNPGFSCTDYDWSTALKAAASSSSSLHGSSLSSTPFLVTTNTEMEGYADIKCLVDGGYIDSKEIPAGILETFSDDDPSSLNDKKYSSHNDDDDEEEKKFFFCENPYAGLRVRQSGTMANDLYVKSRWVMGGLFVPDNKKMAVTTLVNKSKSKKKRRKDSEERRSSSDVHRKKKRRKGDGSNPALI